MEILVLLCIVGYFGILSVPLFMNIPLNQYFYFLLYLPVIFSLIYTGILFVKRRVRGNQIIQPKTTR